MIKIRRGTDVVLHIALNGNNLHTFGEIKSLQVYIQKQSGCHKHTHLPTTTSTNLCCLHNTMSSSIELNSLVTSSDKDAVLVDALFPADLQTVSGVYSLLIRWSEKTEQLIANDLDFTFTFTVDINNDTFELVDDISEINTPNNEVNLTYTFAKQFVGADGKYFKVQ